jgi:hypothetical protein
MPGQLIYNNSTFNRNNQSGISSGFYSRTLFSYHTVNNDEYNLSSVGDWFENNNFTGITWLQNNIPERCHGSNILPPYYWRPGKNIRIRGTFFVGSTNQNCKFNMQFGIYNSPSGFQALAIQNNGFNHYFNNTYNTKPNEEEAAKLLPINFLCDIMCGVINDVVEFKIEGGGYYQYCWRRFDQVFSNGNSVYVPLLNHSNRNTFIVLGDDYYNQETSLEMNIFGSTVDKCYIRNLTIEELA